MVRRTAPVQEAQRRKRGVQVGLSTSSRQTTKPKHHGSLVEGVQHMCGSRNVQKVGAENMQIT